MVLLKEKNMDNKIGIIGIGIVGKAVSSVFPEAILYDKYKNIGSIQDINNADIIFICVPTPYTLETGFDFSAVDNAISILNGSKIVVIKSTVLPGTTEYLQDKYPNHKILFNPEFLRAAFAKEDMVNPSMQIIGTTQKSVSEAQNILNILPKAPFSKIIFSKEAEMVKYFINSFLATKVIFANQIYDLCNKAEIDYNTIKECVVNDKRIGESHLEVKAGRGYGGACFPKDVRSLINYGDKLQIDLRLLKTMEGINEHLRIEKPKISIIIPCRNEERFIGRCLDSLLANDYPKEKIEIFIINGMSEDKTLEIAKDYQKKYPFISILGNPKKITPTALNIGIKASHHDILIRIDAHATYKKDYLSKSVKFLDEHSADNVGGIWIIVPRENTLIGKAIAQSLSHRFGTGNAYYKIGAKELKWVDTVPFGCYRKEIFSRIGGFNENLVRSQDMEFNLRLRRNGGKILLIPEIVGYYYVRSNLREFFDHNFKDGVWAIYPLKFVRIPLRLRHYIPFIFVMSMIILAVLSIFISFVRWIFLAIILLYILTSLVSSLQVAYKTKDWKLFFAMPLAFFTRHLGYGLGSVWGTIKLALPLKNHD
jgi:glycosyltransferase involved in cell wall biosynthesis